MLNPQVNYEHYAAVIRSASDRGKKNLHIKESLHDQSAFKVHPSAISVTSIIHYEFMFISRFMFFFKIPTLVCNHIFLLLVLVLAV